MIRSRLTVGCRSNRRESLHAGGLGEASVIDTHRPVVVNIVAAERAQRPQKGPRELPHSEARLRRARPKPTTATSSAVR